MHLRRLRPGEWLAATSGVVLLVSLWLPWYGVFVGPDGQREGSFLTYEPPGEASLSAWQSLSALDILLAFVAAAGVALALVTATQRVPAIPVALAAFVTLAGVVGVVLVLLRLLDAPGWAQGREPGLWLALAASAGIVGGGWWAMCDERGPATEAPEIELLPSPRPE